MNQQTAIVLDVSTLQPPEPMDLVMQAMDKLATGQYIKMIHRMQPYPLYNILLDNGFRYRMLNPDGLFHIYIWKASDKQAETAVKSDFS